MGIQTGDRIYEGGKDGPMTCENFGFVTHFIESLPGLYELYITDLDPAVKVIVPAILESQKSLQTLSYLVPVRRIYYRSRKLPYAWTTAQLRELRQKSPDLSCLEVDFPLKDGKWPSDHAETLARFNHLKSLKVFVKLNNDASDFAAEYHQDVQGTVPLPPFNEALGREVTTSLFRSFFLNDAYARLTDLEVYFTRIQEYDRGQTSEIEFPIKIRRLENNDAPSPVNGGFTVECRGIWLGGY